MKTGKRTGIIMLLLIIVLAASACSSKGNSSMDTAASTSADMAVKPEEANGELQFSAKKDANDTTGSTREAPETEEAIANSTAFNSENVQSQDKIIQYYYLNVETQNFDQLISDISAKISSLGGYVEKSQIGGRSLYDSNVTRSGSIVARIPSDKADEFVNNVNDASNVTNSEKTTENVSLQYIDAQSRIEALEIEQERLFAILEKAEDLENIITLESRLSDIRYELQNYKSQLRAYDNKVEYSFVSLNIKEVNRITPVTEEKQTLGDRITNGFSDTMYHISEGGKNFLVWFIVNLPYLFIWGIIIFFIIKICLRYLKKSKVKKQILPYNGNSAQSGYMTEQTTDQRSNRQSDDGE